jgi:hypothetical protein
MTEADGRTQQGSAEARARLDELKRFEAELRGRLERERAEGPRPPEELQAAVEAAQASVNAVQSKIDAAKLEAKRLKGEIEELDQTHEAVPEDERMIRWPRLVGEKMRRLAELGLRESEITSLEAEKWATMHGLEEARHRLAAHESGVHERSIEEDPRLVSLREELAEAEVAAAVKGARKGATKGTKRSAKGKKKV